MDTLVVALGRDESDASVIAAAGAIAARIGADIRLIHAAPAGEHDEARQPMERSAASLGRATTISLLDADPAAAIIEAAAASTGTIIVMGDPGRSALGDLIAGSVTGAVLARSDRPVIVVGPGGEVPAAQAAPVIVCIDDRPECESIIGPAVHMAESMRTSVVLVEVVPPEERVEIDDVPPIDAPTAHGKGRLAAITRRLDAASASDITTRVLYGADVADTVAHFARQEGAALIALATHGRSGVQRLLRGSTTHHLVTIAPCPVLAVHCAVE